MTLAQEIHPALRHAFLAVPATILLIIPSLHDPINIPKLLVLIAITFTATLQYLALRKYSPKKIINRTTRVYCGLYALLAISMILSGIAGSQNYIRILFGFNGRNNGLLYYLSSFLIVAVILFSTIGRKEIRYFSRILVWTSLLFGTYCLVQFLNLDPVPWSNPYSTVIGTLGNPNFSASALAVFSVFWLYMFSTSNLSSKSKKVSQLMVSFALAFLSWRTESLQGLVVIGLGYSFVGFLKLREKETRRHIGIVFYGAIALGLMVSFGSFLGFGPLGNLLEQYTLRLRGWYAFIGFQAMVNSPWTGVGVDSYLYAFRSLRSDEFVAQYGASLTNNNAHSTPAQIGATFGVIAFLLYVLIHFLVLFKAVRIINSRSNEKVHLKGIAILWILIFAQSLLSIEVIGLGVMNWIFGAILLSADDSLLDQNAKVKENSAKKTKTESNPTWLGAFTILAFLIGSLPAILIYREDSAFISISRTQITDNVSKVFVRENFKRLSDFTLLSPERVDEVLGNMYRAEMFPEVKSIVTRLYSVSSNDVRVGDMLAIYYHNTGQFDQEVKIRETLRIQDPWNVYLELALAQAHERVGNYSELAESVSIIKRLAPESPEYDQAKALLESDTRTRT